jgi:predicted ATPase
MIMREKIIIKNFSVLKDIELEINKFNIFIGEQATGKSLIAKLVQYFQQINENIFSEFVKLYNESNKDPLNYTKKLKNIRPLDKELIIRILKLKLSKLFTEKFPIDLVSNYSNTEVEYIFNKNLKVTINIAEKEYLIIFPKKIEEKIFQLYCEFVEFQNKEVTDTKGNEINENLQQKLSSIFFPEKERRELFISDDRNTHLKPNRYSDREQTLLESLIETGVNKNFNYQSENFSKILKGKMGIDRGDDYNARVFLESNRNKLQVDFFSSGQKAFVAFPIIFGSFSNSSLLDVKFTFFIEEPENHIFPNAQKEFIEILCEFYNDFDKKINSIFITTHSPYILTSFNNLIQADNTYKTLKDKLENKEITEKQFNESEKKLFEIISKTKHIAFEDVSAFYIENGLIYNMKDIENRLISSDIIDDVSNVINSEFIKLIELENDTENE